jgi:hypothetical protein
MVMIELVNGQRVMLAGPTAEEVLEALYNGAAERLVEFSSTSGREFVNPQHVVRVIES